MQNLVETKDICMKFPSGDGWTEVLHNISIAVLKNQLTMLVGPSGCGKTTLLSIITGILTPSSGKIFIDNQDISEFTDDEKVLLRRRKIGFVFQQYNLLPTLTAAENAAIPLIADGVSLKEAVEKAGKIFEQIGLYEHRDKTPNQLSGGQQQRVSIARALIHNPNLIVCDEPTAALDEQNGIQVMQILKNISQESDKAVLIVTHDNRIFKFADRIIKMNDGRIIDHV